MKTLALLRALGPVDLKNLCRDSLLVWMLAIPLVMALALRLGSPAVAGLLWGRYGFDLAPYYPLITDVFVATVPMLMGMVVGFLLLDERDDRVLTALLVTPMPLGAYLAYRLIIPTLIAIAATLIGFPLVGLISVPPASLLAAVVLSAFGCPLTALFLGSFAENKVAGLAAVKFVNAIGLLPIAAYFLPEPWQLVAGIVPTYWPLRIFWLGVEGRDFGFSLIAGTLINLLALALLLRRFVAVVHR
jgi:fluoroquinolone transport system permease protein